MLLTINQTRIQHQDRRSAERGYGVVRLAIGGRACSGVGSNPVRGAHRRQRIVRVVDSRPTLRVLGPAEKVLVASQRVTSGSKNIESRCRREGNDGSLVLSFYLRMHTHLYCEQEEESGISTVQREQAIGINPLTRGRVTLVVHVEEDATMYS